MITVYPEASRYRAEQDWLRSRFSFSFGDYYDPANTGFGPLRVLNDDIVQGGRGFGAHPHREMEIVTIVLRGRLRHEDSTGQTAETTFGGVQRMSAGTGIIHSEVNPGDEPVELLQLWFTPDRRGYDPSYETTLYDPQGMAGKLLPVVSEHGGERVASIHQAMTIYLAKLAAGQTLAHAAQPARKLFLFIIEGSVRLAGGERLARRDSARIEGEAELALTADADAFFMLIDMP